MTKRILVIDDDRRVLKVVQDHLNQAGMTPLCVDNCTDGLRLIRDDAPDVILVDAAMPDLDGFALCRLIKKEAKTRCIPVVIMSGQWIDERNVVTGFRSGADDYVLKPFSLPVLVARLEAVMRRYHAAESGNGAIVKHGLKLDPASREVSIKGRKVPLTRKEFDLLAALLERPGRVQSTRRLLEIVWGYDPSDYNDPGTVEVHVHYLRKKLGPALGRRIVTVLGHGYKFSED